MKREYIQFFGKLFLFVILFVIIDLMIGALFSKLSDKAYERNMYSDDLRWRYSIESAIPDIVIIGSSTANHHYISRQIEDSLGMSVYNLGSDGCFLIYQSTIINLILDRYKPKCIIWEVGEACLSTEKDNNKEFQNISNFYDWYNHPYVKKVVNKRDRYQRIRMMSNSYRNNSKFLKYLRHCLMDCNNKNKGYIPLESENVLKESLNEQHERIDFKLNDRNVAIFSSVLLRCRKENVPLIITSSPRYWNDDIKHTDYYLTLRKIADENNIPFLDFYNVEPFNSRPDYFYDRMHMNHKGTERYMEVFIPELKRTITEIKNSKYIKQ